MLFIIGFPWWIYVSKCHLYDNLIHYNVAVAQCDWKVAMCQIKLPLWPIIWTIWWIYVSMWHLKISIWFIIKYDNLILFNVTMVQCADKLVICQIKLSMWLIILSINSTSRYIILWMFNAISINTILCQRNEISIYQCDKSNDQFFRCQWFFICDSKSKCDLLFVIVSTKVLIYQCHILLRYL